MKNLLRLIKNWANESNGKMILVSVLSVLVIGLPFMIGIYFISTTIPFIWCFICYVYKIY
jgi:hypothetical protein